MKTAILAFAALALSASSLAAEAPWSYEAMKDAWLARRDSRDYQRYASEFVQYTNYYHVDQKGNCYALSHEPVELMLIITQPENDKFAQVEHVLSNVDNAKAQCFEKAYRGLRTRQPPYLPFVLQLQMN